MAFNLGGNIVTIQGGGTVGIGGGYSITNGSFNLTAGQLYLGSSASRNTFSSATVTVGTGVTLKLMANTSASTGNAVEQAGTVTLNGGTLAFGNNNGTRPIVISGNIATTGSSTIAVQNTNSGSSTGGAVNNITGAISGTGTLTLTTSQTNSQITTLAGTISNSGGTLAINKTGNDTIVLANSNSYTGTTKISAGFLAAGTSTSFGTGTLDIDGGGVTSSDTTTRSFANAFSLSSSAVLGSATTGNLLFTGSVALGNAAGGAKTMTVNNAQPEFSGILASTDTTGSLTKSGTGDLLLSGASTYQKATVVSAGSLSVTGSLTGTQVTVNSGGKIGGTGSITTNNKPFTLNSGSLLDPGTNGTTGMSINTGTNTLDISAAVTGSNVGALLFNLRSVANSDKITVSLGTLAIGSGELSFADFAFTTGLGFGEGTYTLFDTTASINGTLAVSGLTGTVNGLNATLAISGNDVVLQVVPEPGAILSLLGGIALLLGRRRQRRA